MLYVYIFILGTNDRMSYGKRGKSELGVQPRNPSCRWTAIGWLPPRSTIVFRLSRWPGKILWTHTSRGGTCLRLLDEEHGRRHDVFAMQERIGSQVSTCVIYGACSIYAVGLPVHYKLYFEPHVICVVYQKNCGDKYTYWRTILDYRKDLKLIFFQLFDPGFPIIEQHLILNIFRKK